MVPEQEPEFIFLKSQNQNWIPRFHLCVEPELIQAFLKKKKEKLELHGN